MDNDFKAKYNEPKIEELLDKLAKGGANPTGTIISFMGNTPPEGYLACDGSEYPVEDYPDFVEYLQTQFNDVHYFGGGSETFCVPDLRGEFLRGTGANSHFNIATNTEEGSGEEPGIHQQASTFGAGYTTSDNGQIYFKGNHLPAYYPYLPDSWRQNDGNTAVFRVSLYESSSYSHMIGLMSTRPTNTSVLYCIKT